MFLTEGCMAMSRRAASVYLVVLLAGIAGLAVVVERWSLIAGSSALSDYVVLALACAGIAAATAAAGLWMVRQKAPHRLVRFLGSCGLVGLCAALVGGMLFAWAGSDAQGRYNRAYGDTGRCLAGTSYAASNVTIVQLPDVDEKVATKTQPARPALYDRFAVRPAGMPRSTELVLDTPDSGDIPVPENTQTKNLLQQYGCL